MHAINGVFVLGSILDIKLNKRPSDDIAYKIRGRGNMVPYNLLNNG